MFFKKVKVEHKLTEAFQKLFYEKGGVLKKEGEVVLAFLRDEAGGRGELGKLGRPYFYDANNRFDEKSAIFLLGKRRIFDLVVKYLSLNEKDVFNLATLDDKESDFDELNRKLDV